VPGVDILEKKMTTITIDRAVVEQAVEALEHMADEYGFTNKANRIERWKSVAALREALNAPQPEPVPLQHKHEWIRTGAMQAGECRCISCGAWNRENFVSRSQ